MVCLKWRVIFDTYKIVFDIIFPNILPNLALTLSTQTENMLIYVETNVINSFKVYLIKIKQRKQDSNLFFYL